jgi:hypothetical protein
MVKEVKVSKVWLSVRPSSLQSAKGVVLRKMDVDPIRNKALHNLRWLKEGLSYGMGTETLGTAAW